MTTTNQTPEPVSNELPPLPEPKLWHDKETGHWKVLTKPDRPTYEPYYTADQMSDYARAALAAKQEPDWKAEYLRVQSLFEKETLRASELHEQLHQVKEHRDHCLRVIEKLRGPETQEWVEFKDGWSGVVKKELRLKK